MSDEEVFSLFADGLMRLDRIVPAELTELTEEPHGHGHAMAADAGMGAQR